MSINREFCTVQDLNLRSDVDFAVPFAKFRRVGNFAELSADGASA
jgi:hypothetical protein